VSLKKGMLPINIEEESGKDNGGRKSEEEELGSLACGINLGTFEGRESKSGAGRQLRRGRRRRPGSGNRAPERGPWLDWVCQPEKQEICGFGEGGVKTPSNKKRHNGMTAKEGPEKGAGGENNSGGGKSGSKSFKWGRKNPKTRPARKWDNKHPGGERKITQKPSRRKKREGEIETGALEKTNRAKKGGKMKMLKYALTQISPPSESELNTMGKELDL